MKEEMLDLIDRMKRHRQSGGSPFDCPSMSAPDHLKRELYRATHEIFMQEIKKVQCK